MFLVNSGDAVESSHPASSSPSISASSDDLSPSSNVEVFFFGFLVCGFAAATWPPFFKIGCDVLRGRAVAEWFLRRFTWDKAFLGSTAWEEFRLTGECLGLSGGVGPDL